MPTKNRQKWLIQKILFSWTPDVCESEREASNIEKPLHGIAWTKQEPPLKDCRTATPIDRQRSRNKEEYGRN